MFRAHTRGLRLSVCAGLMVLAGGAGAAWGADPAATRVPTTGHRGTGGGVPTVSLLPISSNGPYMIDGGEIVVPRGGVQVTLEIHFHDWSQFGPSDDLLSFQFTIDSRGYRGANAFPPSPGVDLHPLGFPDDRHLGGFATDRICADSGRDCSNPPSPCNVPVEGACVPNPRYILGCCNPLSAVAKVTQDYEYGAAIQSLGYGPCDHYCASGTPRYCSHQNHCDEDGDCPGEDCIHGPSYVGTLVLEVPMEASGSYSVDFIDDINRTFFCTASCTVLRPPPQTAPATITIQGACCLPGGGCSLLSGVECEAAGGTVTDEFDCEGDMDGDGVDVVCGDECPDDPLKTSPGQCGCGTPDDDADGDGVADCVDVCPGADDAEFGEECAAAIPAASTWGVIVLTLLLAVAGKVGFEGRGRVEKARQ